MTKLATAYVELIPSMQGSESIITQSLVPAASSAGDAAGAAAGGLFGSKFGSVLGAGAIVAGVVGAFVGLYQVGAVFDDVSDTIRVGTGATGEALAGLEADARAVATTVPASFEAAGQTVADLNTRLGLSGDSLQTVASQYLEAGRILGEDVDVNSTTAAFNAFRIEGEEVSGALDSLFQVSQATGVGMNELASAAQSQAPAMQALGFSYEDTISLVGGLDKAGLNATQVMSSMGRGLVSLARDGEEPQAAFQRVTGEIESLIASGDTAAAIDLASGIFGTRGATQFVGAVESGQIALDDLMGGLGATGDTILGVGRETMDFAEAWALVKNQAVSALEPIGTAIFSGLGSAMLWVSDALGGLPGLFAPVMPLFESIGDAFSGAFGQIGEAFAPIIPLWVEMVSAGSPIFILFNALAPVLPMIADAFGQLGAVLSGAFSEVLQVIVPIIVEMSGVVTTVLGQALQMLIPVIMELVGVLGPIFSSVLGALMPILTMVGDLFMALVPIVMPLIDAVFALVQPVLSLVAPLVQLVGAILEPLIGLFVAILEPILALVEPLIGFLVPAIEVVIGVLSGLIGWIVEGITWFVNLVTGAGSSGDQLNAIFTAVGAFIGSVWSGISTAFNTGVNFIMSVLGGIGAFFTSVWNGAVSAIQNGVNTAVGVVRGMGDTIWNVITGIGTSLYNAGSSIIQSFIDGISSMVGAVGNAVGGIMDFVGSFFPHSPAKRGPLSGSGWTAIADGGRAIVGQFESGLAGMDDVMKAAISAPTIAAALPEGTYGVRERASDGSIILRVYDVDGVLIGSMRAVVDEADRDNKRRFDGGVKGD